MTPCQSWATLAQGSCFWSLWGVGEWTAVSFPCGDCGSGSDCALKALFAGFIGLDGCLQGRAVGLSFSFSTFPH